ncbi:MAG: ABC transporter permease [Chlamydiae bacterium]|nr:ABC transporter permease [Chlamydiota bacterium]
MSLESILRVRALIHKEFLQIIRDQSSLLMAFFLPLLLLFIYGYGISLDMKSMRLSCLMEDRSPPAMSLVESLSHSSFFSVSFVNNKQEMEKEITLGGCLGGLTIPSYFSDFWENKEQQAPLFLVADGSQPNTANFVQNYMTSAVKNWLEQQRVEEGQSTPPLIQLTPRMWYNQELDSHYFLIPGSIAIIMTLIGTILTALVVAREWERGTMEALMATPLSLAEILLGKLVPYFTLGLLSLFVCTGIGCLVFGVPLKGSLFALTLVSSVFLFTCLSLGLFISSLTRNQFHASQIAIVSAFLPAFMLSGFIFEISSMPWRIQLLTYLLPARYMVSSLQTIFLVGDVPYLLVRNCLAMLLFGAGLFGLLACTAKKRIDS